MRKEKKKGKKLKKVQERTEKDKISRDHAKEIIKREIPKRKKREKKLQQMRKKVKEGEMKLGEYIEERIKALDNEEILKYNAITSLAEKIGKETKEEETEYIKRYLERKKGKRRYPEITQKVEMIKEPWVGNQKPRSMENLNKKEKKLINRIDSMFGTGKKEALDIFNESRQKAEPISKIIREREKKNK